MSDISLALEKLRISSSKDKLRLFVGSSLSFKCGEPCLDSLNNAELLELFVSGESWVCRGSGCSVNFTIFTNGQPLSRERRDSLVGGVGTNLRDDSFWSQLSLDATLEVPNNQTSRSHDLSLKINYARREIMESALRSIILPTLGDVKPPAGIPCFELQRVDINMDFRDFPSTVASTLMKYNGPGLEADSMLLDHEPMVDPDNTNHCDEFDMLSDCPDQWVSSELENGFESLLDEDSDLHDEDLLLYKNDPDGTILMSPHLIQVFESLQPADTTPVEGTGGKGVAALDLNLAQRMSGLALHTLIRGQHLREQPGMKVWKNSHPTMLSHIAPALWSPGFLEAMSQRSRFLSPIASVFSTSLLRNAQSPSLRRKLLDLRPVATRKQLINRHRPRCGITIAPQLPIPNCSEINRTIQANLWKMMHLFLYDPNASRRLKTAVTGTSNAIKEDEDGEDSMIEMKDCEGLDEEFPFVREEVSSLITAGLDEFFDADEEGRDDDEFDFLFENWASTKDEELFDNQLDACSMLMDDAEFPDITEKGERENRVHHENFGVEPTLETIPASILDLCTFRDDFYLETESQRMLI